MFINLNGLAQFKEIKVSLYQSSIDLLEDKKSNIDATALVKDEADNYIQIKKLVDADKKKIKKWHSYWAIEYSGNKYFNLGYSHDLNQWGTYAKFDIIGKYCAIFIDSNSRKLVKNGGNLYGGGLMGAMIAGTYKWGKNWIDRNGAKKKILLVDTSILEIGMYAKEDGNTGNLLTKEKLTKIAQTNYPDMDVDKISFEKVVEIIEELNQKNTAEMR
ncbi:hypothetical protein GCM10028773_13500 [Spirosoma koreense]